MLNLKPISHKNLIAAHQDLKDRPLMRYPTGYLSRALLTLFAMVIIAVACAPSLLIFVTVFLSIYMSFYYYLLNRLWKAMGLSRIRLALLFTTVSSLLLFIRLYIKFK